MNDERAASSAQADRIEELLECPCWVIDVLPKQVPAEAGGQFFKVEWELLAGKRVRKQFADVLLKLNCYCDFVVFRGESSNGTTNPAPAKLKRRVLRNKEGLSILLPEEDALVAVPTSSTYMALYHPSDELLELVRAIAGSAGLFVWKSPQSER